MKDAMSHKRYLITGATGFVGGALASQLLRNGHEVWSLVRDGYGPSGMKIVRGQLESIEDCRRAVRKCRPDVVFHLAAQAKVGYARINRLETFESNVRGTYNLLEAVQTCAPFAKVVVASSDKAYGNMVDSKPYNEGDALRGRGIYDVSKSCTDLIAQAYSHSCGLDVAVVRCGNIYGPGDEDPSRIVPSICADLESGRHPTVRSDGTPVRDFLYIQDAIDAYLRVADHIEAAPAGQHLYNFAGGTPCTVKEIATKLLEINKRKGMRTNWIEVRILGDVIDEIPEQVLDCRWTQMVLSWKPRYDLETGLGFTLDWWRTGKGMR